MDETSETTNDAPNSASISFLSDAIAAGVGKHLTPQDQIAWHVALEPWLVKFAINTERRVAAFLGQVMVESGFFTELSENMNYSASRLCAVWPTRFPTTAAAAPYAYQPEALANYVYGGRNGNGPPASGDGFRYRGGGLIQLTFASNYAKFGAAVEKTAADAAVWVHNTKEGAAASACWYWFTNHLNEEADVWNLSRIAIVVNGGNMAAAERVAVAQQILAAIEAPTTT